MSLRFYPGKRLSYDGALCTVRYVGEVAGTKGQWLGVEWDDPSRGKHAGEHGGVRYFECVRKHPTAGSFVRPNRPSDPPRTFVEALRTKYASDADAYQTDSVQADPDVHLSNGSASGEKKIKISGKVVEEVGFDKIRQQLADLHELRIVLLDGMCMTRSLTDAITRSWTLEAIAVRPSDIRDACPNVAELDLSRNLFEDWRDVLSICEQLTRLRNLRVDGNRFRNTDLSDQERSYFASAFANVKTLSLEDTLLSWRELLHIISLFTQLSSFAASGNALGPLREGLLPDTLTELILEDNDFNTLCDLAPLTNLPALQRLRLKNNAISQIIRPADPALQSEPLVFSISLADVDLSYNAISDWALVDELNSVFPGLQSLRVAHNPLYQGLQSADGRPLTADDGYMLTIARLGDLKMLNFSPITAKERLNAETYYLSQIARELAAVAEDQSGSVIARHRRYAELCEEYGSPIVERTAPTVDPNSLAARLIRVDFRPGMDLTQKKMESSFTVELPKSLTIYSVLGIVGKHFGLPPMKLRLVWETGELDPVKKEDPRADDLWDSEDSDNEKDEGLAGLEDQRVYREVELLAGTRQLGTWVERSEATVRVDLK